MRQPHARRVEPEAASRADLAWGLVGVAVLFVLLFVLLPTLAWQP